MEETYEREGDSLKIITQRERLVSMEELQAEKSAIETEMNSATSQFNEVQSIRQVRLDRVNNRITEAQGLGVGE